MLHKVEPGQRPLRRSPGATDQHGSGSISSSRQVSISILQVASTHSHSALEPPNRHRRPYATHTASVALPAQPVPPRRAAGTAETVSRLCVRGTVAAPPTYTCATLSAVSAAVNIPMIDLSLSVLVSDGPQKGSLVYRRLIGASKDVFSPPPSFATRFYRLATAMRETGVYIDK
jgi:hypothetical protein